MKIANNSFSIVNGKSQRGVTLIEVMIAVLVLSIGLLGVAAMQLKALQSASHSYQRSLATMAAQDAVERLWAFRMKEDDCASGSDLNDIESVWLSDWDDFDGSNIDDGPVCRYTVTVAWSEERFDSEEGDISTLIYVAQLPAGNGG